MVGVGEGRQRDFTVVADGNVVGCVLSVGLSIAARRKASAKGLGCVKTLPQGIRWLGAARVPDAIDLCRSGVVPRDRRYAGSAVRIRYMRQADSFRSHDEGTHRRGVILRRALADRERAAAAVPGVIASRRL